MISNFPPRLEVVLEKPAMNTLGVAYCAVCNDFDYLGRIQGQIDSARFLSTVII